MSLDKNGSVVQLGAVNNGQTCNRCRFCSGVAASDKSISFICRRYPPTPVGGPVPVNQGLQVFSNTQFPSIGSPNDHWCGEFLPVLN